MATGAFTLYFYDTDPTERDPQFQTNNNRLLRYEEYGPSAPNVLLRTVFYTYYKTGHVSNITIKDESSPNERRDLALTYSRAGHLWLALRGKWAVDPLIPQLWPNDPGTYASGTYTRDDAFEFRYDSGRQRYLWRQVDTTTFDPLPSPNDINHWTDYVGDDPWGDFDNTSGSSTATEITRYLPGFGSQAKQAVSGSAIDYFMGDLIRSTVLTTDGSGSSTGTQAYSPFGEPVGAATADSERYHYAGGWGYESGLLSLAGANSTLPPITLQHVGERWYQPALGRFIQPDPIGLQGGMHLYIYCANNPLVTADPFGACGVTIHQSVMQLIIQGMWDEALDLTIQLADQGMLNADDAARLKKVIERARILTKWRTHVANCSRKEMKELLKTLNKTFEKHVKKYKDHPDSKELADLRYQINYLEEQLQ